MYLREKFVPSILYIIMRRINRITTIAVIFIVSILLLAFSSRRNFELSQQLSIFSNVIKDLEMFYVDTIQPKKLIKTGIDAMLRSLDPYTVYYPEEESSELKLMITGKYAGVGSVIRYHEDKKTTVIVEPYENMPAAKAGLKIGDAILSVNGTDIHGMSTDSVSNMLRGEAGSTLILQIERPGVKKPMTVKLERATIALPPITHYDILNDSIGYISLESFTEDCSKHMRRAVVDLKERGARMFILDLRGNGGGSLVESINIVNLFVPKGKTIVTTKGKRKQANEEYKTTREPLDTKSPLIVLVDGQSASAAEIVSGSLQDLDRAIIVGSRTFGKGLVQSTMNLPSNGNLKLTTSRYHIPSGRCIQALDYSHRDSQGAAQRIPDSLTNVFYTEAGREVRDGGGIRPDVEPSSEKLTTLLFYLAQDIGIFDYANLYALKYKNIEPPHTFKISDQDYEEFKQFIIKSGFNYDMQSSKILAQLKKMIELEGYSEITAQEVEALEKKLQHNLEHDLNYFANDVKELLNNEIILRYYGRNGAISHNLLFDKELDECYKLFADRERYNKILSPQQ